MAGSNGIQIFLLVRVAGPLPRPADGAPVPGESHSWFSYRMAFHPLSDGTADMTRIVVDEKHLLPFPVQELQDIIEM